MSAFLGPIHFRMYEKIQSQEKLTKVIANLAVEKGWMSAEEVAAFGTGRKTLGGHEASRLRLRG